jgi:zinc transport system permease protein
LSAMMLLATAIGGAVSTLGLALSYGPDLPVGPTIILLAGGLYVISALTSRIFARRRAHASATTPGTGSVG